MDYMWYMARSHEKIKFCFGISCREKHQKNKANKPEIRNSDSRKEHAKIQNKCISPAGHPMLWISKWISCNSLGYSLDMPYMAGIASDFIGNLICRICIASESHAMDCHANSLDVRSMTPVSQQQNPTHVRAHQGFEHGSFLAKGWSTQRAHEWNSPAVSSDENRKVQEELNDGWSECGKRTCRGEEYRCWIFRSVIDVNFECEMHRWKTCGT